MVLIKPVKVYLFLFELLSLLFQQGRTSLTMAGNVKCYRNEVSRQVLSKTKADTVIVVNTQSKFDSVQISIRNALRNGYRNIHVKISQGVFFFEENHLRLEFLNYPDVDIVISGNNTKIVAKGNDYFRSYLIFPKETVNFTLLDEHFNPVNLWSPLSFAKDTVEVIDSSKHVCRLKIPQDFLYADWLKNPTKIKITQWYTSNNYDILKIDGGYIYFYVNDLSYNKNLQSHNVNFDFTYGKKPVRFGIYMPSCSSKTSTPNFKSLHSCECSRFLFLKDCVISSFTMKNLEFCGNSNKSDLMEFNNCKTNRCSIEGCTFSNISSTLLYVIKTNNFLFTDNLVCKCYGRGVTITNDCNNAVVCGNVFDKCGLSLIQNSCVHCAGTNYLIIDNIFRNFTYSAISVGVWHGTTKTHLSSGIVEYNEIYYDSVFLSHCMQYTLMDGGAIYSCTQNDNAVVRYNYIHDYDGMYDNRGVFCDDGTCNITICDNVIDNIVNSYYIDLRLCPAIINVLPNANSGNYIGNNFLYGPVRFQGLESDVNSNCYQQNQTFPNDIIANVYYKNHKYKVKRASLVRSIKKHILKNNRWGRRY